LYCATVSRDAVLVIDDTALAKKGTHSVGALRNACANKWSPHRDHQLGRPFLVRFATANFLRSVAESRAAPWCKQVLACTTIAYPAPYIHHLRRWVAD
jgi:hypothetical protein